MSEESTETTETTVLKTPAAGEKPAAFTWHGKLSADFSDGDFVKGFPDTAEGLGKMVKGAQHANKMVGAKGIIPPGKNADIHDWASFYGQLGRPDDPSLYDISSAEFDKGVPRNKDTEANMLQVMYDAGLSQSQAATIFKGFAIGENATHKGNIAAREENARQAEADLSLEFGTAKSMKMSLAESGFAHLFGEGSDEFLTKRYEDGTRLGDDVQVIKAMAKLGTDLQEAGIIDGDTRLDKRSPAEAAVEIKRLHNDEEFMKVWNNRNDPGFAAAYDKMMQLNEAVARA